ncbi:MAG: CoA-binding protein [Bacteroidia bacterium]
MSKSNDYTLVVGASENPSRYSFLATVRLRENGIPVKCFGKKSGTIGDVKIETTLPEKNSIHTITLYINPTHQEQLINELLALNPKRIIFNPGTENPLFENKARELGIETLRACTLVLLSTNSYQETSKSS